MRLILCSSGNVERMHAAQWLGKTGLDVYVVTHTNEMRARIREVMPYAEVIVTGITGLGFGMLASSRNYINVKVLKKGEWYIGGDDNGRGITSLPFKLQSLHRHDMGGIPPSGYKSWREAFDTPLPTRLAPLLFRTVRDECDRMGTIYGGLSAHRNPFYRRSGKWSYCKFVTGKMYVLRQTKELVWHGGIGSDAALTTWVKANYGSVVVDNYAHVIKTRFEAGGLGSWEARVPSYTQTAEYLVKEFPGLVSIDRSKKMFMRLDVHTLKALERWRKEHGYI